MSTTADTARNPFAPEDEAAVQRRRRVRKAKDDTAASAGPGWTLLAMSHLLSGTIVWAMRSAFGAA